MRSCERRAVNRCRCPSGRPGCARGVGFGRGPPRETERRSTPRVRCLGWWRRRRASEARPSKQHCPASSAPPARIPGSHPQSSHPEPAAPPPHNSRIPLPASPPPAGIDVRELIARFEHITAAEERGDRSAMQRRDAAGEGQGTGRGGRPRGAHRPHCAVGGWPCLDCFKTANQSPPVL